MGFNADWRAIKTNRMTMIGVNRRAKIISRTHEERIDDVGKRCNMEIETAWWASGQGMDPPS
jgi:hypothetical protein